jgi:DNA-directed RNA polymerase subunit M/transcription elongation factor TFIIS
MWSTKQSSATALFCPHCQSILPRPRMAKSTYAECRLCHAECNLSQLTKQVSNIETVQEKRKQQINIDEDSTGQPSRATVMVAFSPIFLTVLSCRWMKNAQNASILKCTFTLCN